MTRKISTMALLIGALFTDLSSAAPLQARLDITPAHVLPGLPALFTLSISNRDNVPRSLRNVLRMRATPAAGPSFLVRWGSRTEESAIPNAGDPIILGPSETREFYIPGTALLLANEAFWDDRLTRPGTYDLRAELGDNFDTLTNTARLFVDQPAGDDLQVWKLMQQLSGGGWPTNLWLTRHSVVSGYPRSKYSYATTVIRTPRSQLTTALPPAVEGSSGPIRDDLRLALVSALRMAADDAFRASDLRTSDTLTIQAGVQIEQLRREASSAYANKQAQQQFDEIAALTLARHLDPQGKSQYKKLTPLGPCKGENGTLKFGYSNDNKWPIMIRVGPDNKFDPQPADRAQPSVFASGKHSQAFTVPVLPNEVVKWTLDGTVLSYQPAALKACTSGEKDD